MSEREQGFRDNLSVVWGGAVDCDADPQRVAEWLSDGDCVVLAIRVLWVYRRIYRQPNGVAEFVVAGKRWDIPVGSQLALRVYSTRFNLSTLTNTPRGKGGIIEGPFGSGVVMTFRPGLLGPGSGLFLKRRTEFVGRRPLDG